MATTNSSLDLVDQTSPCRFLPIQSAKFDIFFIHFPALALDIAMKEIAQNGHDDERMVLVFNAFDQIIPQLGVFTPIAAALRNEIFGSEKSIYL